MGSLHRFLFPFLLLESLSVVQVIITIIKKGRPDGRPFLKNENQSIL